MDRKEKLEEILGQLGDISSVSLENYLKDGGFLTAPASTKFHGNYDGGLFDHSVAVMETLVKLTHDNNLKWQRKASPYVIALSSLCSNGLFRTSTSLAYFQKQNPDKGAQRKSTKLSM